MNGNEICRKLDDLSAAGATLGQLFSAATEEIHQASDRFHWTGIYELIEENTLRLGPFVGPPSDHVFIAVGDGICGCAVAEKRNKNVPDVSVEPNYLACSTSTRSELVVLIRKGKEIFAQIDIDSDEFDAFDRKTEREVQKVADRLADACACHREREA